MSKIREKISLTNKYFYWFIFVILIMILTGINNLYFYKHVERTAYRDTTQLKELLQLQIKLCIQNNISINECNDNLIQNTAVFANTAYYNLKTEIRDFNNKIIWEKPEKDWDRVAHSEIIIILPNKNDFSDFKYHNTANFNISLFIGSVFKSMTFSITDFYKVTYDSGMKEAISNFNTIYWYRSRPAIGFAIFTYLILWLSRKRTYKLEELQEKEDLKIKETFQEDLKNNIDIMNTSIIKDKITKYDNILNPPINALKFENLFDDLDTIGTKFRKVTEKIIFQVYENQIGKKPLKMTLSNAIYELHKEGILSDTARNYISIVRVYGNISSHYSDNVICKEEAIAIASSLLNVIDEIYEKNLLGNSKLI
jgi:hypothetical protein